jgi:SAM-dependent methyltransferase
MADSMNVFDRALVRLRRDKVAARLKDADFLLREGAARLADRLFDITRDFPVALDLGCHTGQLGAELRGHPKIGRLMQCDVSTAMARGAVANGLPTFAADEEALPVAEGSLDLVISNLSLHWVNDLPGAFAQIRRALKPDGLFLCTLFGGETLRELRTALLEAETEIAGGVTPRVSPFVDVRDAGNLLTRAGFGLPVADADSVTVTYADMFKLMADLRAMAETNAVIERTRTPSRRAMFLRAAQIYAERFANPAQRITATFQLVTLTAWAPHQSQQKPLRPGSAKASLADALGTDERRAGETIRKPH